jgi:hypothetical protein
VSRLSAPALIRLPSDFAARPVVPETGAVTVVHDRFSSA